MLGHDLVGTSEEGFDDPVGPLSPERLRELGEAADIREQDSYLTTFSLCRGRRFRLGGSIGIAEAGDGLDQPLAMSERRDPQLAQIVGIEIAQGGFVDVVGRERVCVPTKPQLLEPFADIHHRLPDIV
ncbi:MAG TPA: hypothetical protein VFT77_06475 [Reyranella sp.]|nr:hypothetical protein [Reyranella sp.]